MVNILVFGDSITYGAWDEEGGWVQRLRKYLELYYETYNLGVSGDTTDNLINRFDFEAKARIDANGDNIILFSIGTNDCLFLKGKKSYWVEERDFKNNLKLLVKLAKQYSKKIVFLGLTLVDESKVNPLPWDTDKSNNNKSIALYNKIIKTIAVENKLLFIDIYEYFNKIKYKELLEDGDHPNTEGHKLIFEIVKESLIKNKLI